MASQSEVGRPEHPGSSMLRLGMRLLRLGQPNAESLDAFADRLVATFSLGLAVPHPQMGTWFATIDAMDPEDNQVGVLMRLSPTPPEAPREAPRRTLAVEPERGEVLDRSDVGDLLLSYSFPLLLSLERNLVLFREFAQNELARLRTHARERVGAASPLGSAVRSVE